MRLAIELNGKKHKVRTKRASLSRAVMTVVGLHFLVIGGVLMCEGIAHLNTPADLSHEDAMIIRSHLRDVRPPAPVFIRILNACRQLKQVFQVEPEYVSPPSLGPVRITLLIHNRSEIRIVTESNGVHIYDRSSKEWFVDTDTERDVCPPLPEPEVTEAPKPKSNGELYRELGLVRI
jgi:hypothetical protein